MGYVSVSLARGLDAKRWDFINKRKLYYEEIFALYIGVFSANYFWLYLISKL